MIVGTEKVLYSWFFFLFLFFKFIKYIIYFKYILKYKCVRSGLASLYFYDPNLTRPVIKKFFVTQPNSPIPKNRPNPTG